MAVRSHKYDVMPLLANVCVIGCGSGLGGFLSCCYRIRHAQDRSCLQGHPVGAPVAVLGLALILLHTKQPPEPELLLMETAMDAGPWLASAVLGTTLVLSGAPTYSDRKPLPLFVGWVFVFSAWYLMLAIIPK